MAPEDETPAVEEQAPPDEAPAEAADTAEPVDGEPAPAAVKLAPAREASWAQVWHLPVLLLGLTLFGVGLWQIVPEPKQAQWDQTLDNVEELLDARVLVAQDILPPSEDEPVEEPIGPVFTTSADGELELLRPFLEEAPVEAQARYYQYQADLNYLLLRRSTTFGTDTETSRTNRQKILDDYRQAEELGRELDTTSIYWMADTLAALGRHEEAIALLDRFSGDARRRYLLVRRLVDRERERPRHGEASRVVELLERFRKELASEDDDVDRGRQLLWMHETHARVHLEAHDAERAIAYLNEAILRMRSAGVDDLSPLFVLLGQAYLADGDFPEAERRLLYAQDLLDPSDPLNVHVLVGLAEVQLVSPGGTLTEARRLYQRAEEDFRGTKGYLEALIGLADTEARSRTDADWELSLGHFRQAIRTLAEQTPVWDERREEATQRIQLHIDHLTNTEDYGRALDFLSLLERLHGRNMPDELVLTIADTHRRLAEVRSVSAEALDPRNPGPGETSEEVAARQGSRRIEAAQHYEQAAHHYLNYARGRTQLDDEGHGQALWQSAQCYDLAQMPREAIRVYDEFVQTRDNDPRAAEAINRLGRAYMADGQFATAVEQFEHLDRKYPQSSWAADALVPKAQCYIRQDRFDAAERTLLSVIQDHESIRPDSEPYREALIALGTLYYIQGPDQPGQFEEAFRYLQMAVDRYGDTPQGPRLRYLLGDAYRQSVSLLEDRLMTIQSQSERLAFQHEREDRLQRAQALFREAREALELIPEEALTDRERLCHRNAFFYEADCAFDRGDYEGAIQLYSNAASRWQAHPASLVAMVQIVNAHAELGQYQQARVANGHALDLLERLDDAVFEDQSVPMSREHWEDWLRWTSELDLLTSDAGDGGLGG